MIRNSSYILLIFLMLLGVNAFAQPEKISNAIFHYQNGNLEKAKGSIDSACVDPSTINDPEAWHIKGFIYKELHKKLESASKGLTYRTVAIDAFNKSMSLDKENQRLDDNKKNLKALASTFYNDAATFLDTVNYEKAVKYFNIFKETMSVGDPDYNFDKKEIEFKLALASQYSKLYETNRKARESFLNKTKELYADVIKMDSNNVSANYNMGILYYNQAVNIIKEMDYDVDIFELSNTQDNTIVLFKESLPYMEKAYQLDPDRKETLIGLSGIYFSLNEEEKSKAFKAKVDALDKK